jgi:hypothetical protein
MANENNRMFNAKQPEESNEMEAVKTTIVGGRPPGSGKNLTNIPRGIEVLVKKASIDTDFRSLLIAKRDEAAREIGLELNPMEKNIIRSAPEAQLIAIINSVKVSPRLKPAFLGKVAGVMLAALGATSMTGCGEQSPPVTGIRPDGPNSTTDKPPVEQPVKPDDNIPATKGIMIDIPKPITPTDEDETPPATRGVSPDLPKPKTEPPDDDGVLNSPAGGMRSDSPKPKPPEEKPEETEPEEDE